MIPLAASTPRSTVVHRRREMTKCSSSSCHLALRDLAVRLSSYTRRNSRGRYSIRGLVPGTYRVVALEEFEPGAQWRPEFLNEHDDQGEVLQVEDGSRLALDLDVIAGAEK